MLRESVNSKDNNFQLGSITDGVDDDQGIPHASLLAEYAEIVVARDADNISNIRDSIIRQLGDEAFIDVAATVAGFHGVVRMADATGIPVVNDMSLSVSSELNVDHFYASGLGDRGT
jgi:hypothetical protein|tara:strand:+ start:268 stop:618 length:351 start_codon:yes stop_codon:yes gene_type:complete